MRQALSLHSVGLHAALATRTCCAMERMAGWAAAAPRLRLGIVAGDFNYTRSGRMPSPSDRRYPPVRRSDGARRIIGGCARRKALYGACAERRQALLQRGRHDISY